jgi:hypothetical protein
MATLGRLDWYDIARATNWTPTYVTEDELYPPELSGADGLRMEAWESYDEPYKQTYPEYVKVQREKDAGAYSVKAALERSACTPTPTPGWISVMKAHYGAIARGEYSPSTAEARMARFGKAPGMRNMATLGMMDEIRHGQIQLYFPHELCGKDRQFDWAHKAYDTNEWGMIAARHIFDDMFTTRGAAEIALMLTSRSRPASPTCSSSASRPMRPRWATTPSASLISSIQTDESRHAQIGAPAREDPDRERPQGRGAEDRRRRHLASLAPVLGADRPDHGLLHAARAPQAVVQGVHAGVDRHPVRALAARHGPRPALVLGPVHGEIETQHHGQHMGVLVLASRPCGGTRPRA